MESIERQDWLEPVEESVQNAVSKAFEQAGRGVQDALNGVWLGHPLHPVITDIPVGAWTTALLFDIACMSSRKRKYRDAADVAVGLGLAGSALAAITGLADWKDIKGKDRRAGIVHATLNTLVASLYTGSLIARRNRARGLGQALGILGWGVMLTSAWIGGELVYKYRDGVDQSNSTESPDDWTAILAEADLPENELRRAEHNRYEDSAASPRQSDFRNRRDLFPSRRPAFGRQTRQGLRRVPMARLGIQPEGRNRGAWPRDA